MPCNDTEQQLKASEIQSIILAENERQHIFNNDLYPNFKSDSIIILIQVSQ